MFHTRIFMNIGGADHILQAARDQITEGRHLLTNSGAQSVTGDTLELQIVQTTEALGFRVSTLSIFLRHSLYWGNAKVLTPFLAAS